MEIYIVKAKQLFLVLEKPEAGSNGSGIFTRKLQQVVNQTRQVLS